MSRTSRAFFRSGKHVSYRTMDWAGHKAYEHARADLREVGVCIPRYPCPCAWDDLYACMWDEIPTTWHALPNLRERLSAWAIKRRNHPKGAVSIRHMASDD